MLRSSIAPNSFKQNVEENLLSISVPQAERSMEISKRSRQMLVDLDDEFCPLHGLPPAHVYVCGEIIEHLANPGMFLKKLRRMMTTEGEKNAGVVLLEESSNFARTIWIHDH
jgi:hypothetical protein